MPVSGPLSEPHSGAVRDMGQLLKIQDCPGDSGTVGAYDIALPYINLREEFNPVMLPNVVYIPQLYTMQGTLLSDICRYSEFLTPISVNIQVCWFVALHGQFVQLQLSLV